MHEAAARAGRTALDFDYIEAHATGTAVGDPIEGNAIAEAFGGFEREVPLRVSSVKSNVGHMEAAAFHCALLKVVLMMQRRTFAPTSNNFQVPNPEIDFDRCPMRVQTECEPFPDHPVAVGINSFGFGGANGHCVVREYRPAQPRFWSVPLAPEAGFMIPLSARTPKALVESAGRLRRLLDEEPVDLYALAGNLSRRRTHFAARTAFAVHGVTDLMDALDAFAEEEAPIATAEGRRAAAGHGVRRAGDAVGRLRPRSLRGPSGGPPRHRRHRRPLARPCTELVARGLLRGPARGTRRGSTGSARHLHDPVRAGGAVQDLGRLSGLRHRPQLRRGGCGVCVRRALSSPMQRGWSTTAPPCSSAWQAPAACWRSVSTGRAWRTCWTGWACPSASTATGPCRSRSPARTLRPTPSSAAAKTTCSP